MIDLFWDLSQDMAIDDLKTETAKARGEDAVLIEQLRRDNLELQLRISVIIRGLLEREVTTSEELSALVADARRKLNTQ